MKNTFIFEEKILDLCYEKFKKKFYFIILFLICNFIKIAVKISS